MDTISKACKFCNQAFSRRPTEKYKHFKERKYCSEDCRSRARQRIQAAQIPMLPFAQDDPVIGGTKTCSKCGRELPLGEFAKDKSQSSGFKCWCRRCRRLDSLARYRRQQSTPAFKKARREKQKRLRGSSHVRFLSALFYSAKTRAGRAGLVCTLTKDDVLALWDAQGGRCYYSNEPMTYVTGNGKLDTNASLERLNPAEGYTPGNVVLCCYFINVSKRDKSIEEWLSWAEKVRVTREVRHSRSV